MIVTKKHMPRRTVLRGLGISIALPLLDGMVPAFAALRTSAAKPVRRFAAVYMPMGAHMTQWTPTGEGPLQLSPILSPMESVRDRMLVLTGLGSHSVHMEDGGPHARTQAAWLTGVRPKPTEGSDIELGTSADQIIAREFGKETQVDSLQLAIESSEVLGTCAQRYSCAYNNTITWKNPTTPIPPENNPRAIFERLFGDSESSDKRVRLAYLRSNRSILDSVTGELADFRRDIGSVDRTKVDQYLESVRDIERQIQKAEAQADKELPLVEQPTGAPAAFEEHVKLMFDLLAIAYQSDLTRVASYLMAREASNRAYPEIGVSDAHHPLSHHSYNPEKLERMAKINTFYVKLFTYFVEKLKATPEGDGTLLDHSVILFGSGMGDSHLHVPLSLPTIVVSGKGIDITTGRHLRYPEESGRLANLQLSLMEKLGVPEERFGDSTAKLTDL